MRVKAKGLVGVGFQCRTGIGLSWIAISLKTGVLG